MGIAHPTLNLVEVLIKKGTRLGWLINRQDRQIEIYRQGKEVEILHNPKTLSGENVLPHFVLELELIW